jgi:hypothetical protein
MSDVIHHEEDAVVSAFADDLSAPTVARPC